MCCWSTPWMHLDANVAQVPRTTSQDTRWTWNCWRDIRSMRCCSAPSMPLVLIAWGVVHDTLYEKGYKATRFKAKALRGMSPGIQRTAEPHEIAQNLSEVWRNTALHDGIWTNTKKPWKVNGNILFFCFPIGSKVLYEKDMKVRANDKASDAFAVNWRFTDEISVHSCSALF